MFSNSLEKHEGGELEEFQNKQKLYVFYYKVMYNSQITITNNTKRKKNLTNSQNAD